MTEKIKSFKSTSARVYIYAVLTASILVLTRGYFNALETKAMVVELIAMIFLAVSIIATLLTFIKTPANDSMKNLFDSFKAMDHAILLFAFATLISNLVTSHMKESFFGSYGWGIGTLFVVLMCLTYFFLSRNLSFDAALLYIAEVLIGIEAIWVLLNSFYCDPFGLHACLNEKDYIRYVGSYGNVNWYVGFLSIAIPCTIILSMIVRKKWQKIVTTIIMMITFMTGFTANSDGIFLALYTIGFGLMVYGLSDKERLGKVLFNELLCCLSIGILAVLRKIIPSVKLQGIAGYVVEHYIWLIAAAVIAVLLIFTRMLTDEFFNSIKKKAQIAVIILFFVIAGILIGVQIPKMSDKWGHNRGKIWKVAFLTFKDMPFVNKLFGGGISNFGYYYLQETGSDWVRNAHNEYIEYLVTTGIFGGLAYLVTVLSVAFSGIKTLFKEGKELTLQLKSMCYIGILAYAANAFVNNPQATNVAILIIVLAVFRRIDLENIEKTAKLDLKG